MPALATLVALAALTTPADGACAYDHGAMLALTPDAFDQDLQGGWRPLAARPECRAAAADLLRDYRESHRATLAVGALHISYWHEGQMRAEIGDDRRAVPLLLAGVNPNSSDDFADYALGTVAFLQRDRPALEAARARLAALPEPSDWKATQAQFQAKLGFAPSWPANLNVLDGLLACFDKPYVVAYAPPCTQSFRVTKPAG